MGRGKNTTPEERSLIQVLAEEGYSKQEIANRIQRSEHLVRNCLRKKIIPYAKPKINKRNTKLTRRQIGQIKQEATKNKLYASQIVEKLSLPVGKRRVQQILARDSNIKWKKSAKAPPLSSKHKECRLNFARYTMSWSEQWKNIIFSDEKKFNLDGPDGNSHYWHDLKNPNAPKMSRNFGGGSIMVWGGFSYYGKLQLCFLSSKMNSQLYVEMLECVLINYLEENMDKNMTFQQDNASIHVSRVAKSFFSSASIPLLDWPARSPDLNPIENIWGIMSRDIYRNGKQYNTVGELKLAIHQSWLNIEAGTLRNLINSMPKRIFDVIKNKGGITKY